MKALFIIATVFETIAIVGEILLPDGAMIVLLGAISVMVVYVTWWLMQREYEAGSADAVRAFVCRARQPRGESQRRTPDRS